MSGNRSARSRARWMLRYLVVDFAAFTVVAVAKSE